METESSSHSLKKPKGKNQIYASLAFIIVVVVIGVPMWWKTTEVYRIKLPSLEILKLDSDLIKISTNIGIHCENTSRCITIINELTNYFENNDLFNIKFIQIKHIGNISKNLMESSFESLSNKFAPNIGDFAIIESNEIEDAILLTSQRLAFITATTTSTKIYQLLKLNILQVPEIKSICSKNEKRVEIKNLPTQPQNDILISILNPRPDMFDINWNVRVAANNYIIPFLRHLDQVTKMILRTQWRYEISFHLNNNYVNDNSTISRHFELSENNLPHIITSFEKKLGSGIGDNPCFHLIIYFPSCDVSPLYIYKNGQRITRKNIESFISPKWGGVIIYNPPVESCLNYQQKKEKFNFTVNSKTVMETFLYHLKRTIGLHSNIEIDEVKMPNKDSAIIQWEFDAYLRRNTINNIVSATHTLRSLINLLDDINYIVITDIVGKAIIKSYNNIIDAKSNLEVNNLKNASIFAKIAFIESEQAFFDASLLAQLYFPDEQKYAIYIPLFLPIMVPVISSVAIIKYFFEK